MTERAKCDAPPYELLSFKHEPGIYFERIGQMQQTEAAWKLAIKINVAAIAIRYRQLQEYLERTEEICNNVQGDVQQTCQNILSIIEKDNKKLTYLILSLQTMYKTTNNKRGLVNAIGTISKTLFGTMDAEDAQRIDEQLELIRNQQSTLQHAAKHQIKVLNATIGHIETLERSLAYNENLLANITTRMQLQVARLVRREEIDEHLFVITTIMADLISDTTDIIDYLTFAENGLISTRLLPIEEIVAELKEAASQLSRGQHFPFKTQTEDWNVIRRHTTINAFYDPPFVYTILTIPIVTYPIYELIRIMPLPIPTRTNTYTFIKTTHSILAIDRDNHNYITLEENDLNLCIRNNENYICDQNHPVYYVKEEAPCEVHIYIKSPEYTTNCETRHIVANRTIWIKISEPQAWIYSTTNKQDVIIQCDDQLENKIVIERIGKIKLRENCKLTTTDVLIKTKKQIGTHNIQLKLPEFNLTINKENNRYITTKRKETLIPIINNPTELVKLGQSLEEIDEELDNNNIRINKYVIYPISSLIVIIIITATIGITMLIIRKNPQHNVTPH